jgi:nucleoside-diphosphate-sugar epimerase
MADRAKTCLITGGNGYLGSELASLLRASGWRVISAERRPHGSDSVAYSLDGEVSPTLFGGVDALIHGAYDFRPRSWDAIYRKNVLGSRKLIEKAKAAGVATLLISSILWKGETSTGRNYSRRRRNSPSPRSDLWRKQSGNFRPAS